MKSKLIKVPADGNRYICTDEELRKYAEQFVKEARTFILVGLLEENGSEHTRIFNCAGTDKDYELMVGRLFMYFKHPIVGLVNGN